MSIFCYLGGRVGHNTKKCSKDAQQEDLKNYQYWHWLRVQISSPILCGGRLKNRVEIIGDGEEKEGKTIIVEQDGDKLVVLQHMAKDG